MATRYIHRDQAVWEREYLSVEVPDDVPEDEVYEYVIEALASNDYKNFAATEVVDAVDMFDTATTVLPL